MTRKLPLQRQLMTQMPKLAQPQSTKVQALQPPPPPPPPKLPQPQPQSCDHKLQPLPPTHGQKRKLDSESNPADLRDAAHHAAVAAESMRAAAEAFSKLVDGADLASQARQSAANLFKLADRLSHARLQAMKMKFLKTKTNVAIVSSSSTSSSSSRRMNADEILERSLEHDTSNKCVVPTDDDELEVY